MKRFFMLMILLLMAFPLSACGNSNIATSEKLAPRAKATDVNSSNPTKKADLDVEKKNDSGTKIKLTIADNVFTATMLDNATSREFLALLPLTVQLSDLSNREKYGSLPKAIIDKDGRQTNYEVGDLAYWTPGPGVGIFYNQDGKPIKSGSIIIMGKIDSGVEALKNYDGTLKALIERIN